MALTTKFINLLFTRRRERIEYSRKHPHEVQAAQFRRLLRKGEQTLYGRLYGIRDGMTVREFAQAVPVVGYEEIVEYILRAKGGEESVLWPGRVKWFAKSSGTTDAKSKYIPVTQRYLLKNHYQGPRDVITFYMHMFPDTEIYKGKTLTLGGSKRVEQESETAVTGDLSAILISNTPRWAEGRRVPCRDTALTPDFEQKVIRICQEAEHEDVRSFAGVPSWNLVMLNKVLEITGKDNILEVWPNMELFIHGGMNFKPYRELYRKIIPSDKMRYMETYNASEGFFAIGDDLTRDDMLLMLDYDVYYEFIPMATLADHSTAVPLEGVKCGVNYAMLITSSNGLWRYMIGDTVEFTSTSPYRIKITGRTKHFINVFGEEIVVENAESAVRAACDATGAEVAEYTVAPIFMEEKEKGAHEWVVEFVIAPDSQHRFNEVLDDKLKELNSDYEAKRFKNTTLSQPRVTVVERGTFADWMESRGKKGGQNKVPRLYNDRTFVEELLKM